MFSAAAGAARRFVAGGRSHWKAKSAALLGGRLILAAGALMTPLHSDSIADAVEAAAPGVVNISVIGRGYHHGSQMELSSGSGFLWSSDGLVVTNAHVVATAEGGDGAGARSGGGKLKVTLSDGRAYHAVVHGADPLTDLAVLRLQERADLLPGGAKLDGAAAARAAGFPVCAIGCSGELRVGQWVVALGSPLSLQNTATCGIVSATGRLSSELGATGYSRTEFIQTDAPINPGNSGGPLINLGGQVVGINVATLASRQRGGLQAASGISFAIPIDAALPVLKQLRELRRVVRPYLGIVMASIAPQWMVRARLADGFQHWESGVLVTGVHARSPSAQAGLREMDVIVAFQGQPVRNLQDIMLRLSTEDMEVTVVREEDNYNRPIKLRIKPLLR